MFKKIGIISFGLITFVVLLISWFLCRAEQGVLTAVIPLLSSYCAWLLGPLFLTFLFLNIVDKPKTLRRSLIIGGFWGGFIGVLVEAVVLIVTQPYTEGLYVCLLSMYFGVFSIVCGLIFSVLRK